MTLSAIDQIVSIGDKEVQEILKRIELEDLVVALQGASPAVRGKVLANMSKRAGELVLERLGGLGPVDPTEVEGKRVLMLRIANAVL